MREANPLRTLDDRPCQSLNRREALQLAASGVVASFTAHESPASVRPVRRAGKRVVVAGAGIGGRCCAYELMERGHEVTVLEASGRPGGHVKTVHDPLPDGLYADVGAEHFTRPGYDQYWKYVEKFGLPAVPYPAGSTCSGGSEEPGIPRRSFRSRSSSLPGEGAEHRARDCAQLGERPVGIWL